MKTKWQIIDRKGMLVSEHDEQDEAIANQRCHGVGYRVVKVEACSVCGREMGDKDCANPECPGDEE